MSAQTFGLVSTFNLLIILCSWKNGYCGVLTYSYGALKEHSHFRSTDLPKCYQLTTKLPFLKDVQSRVQTSNQPLDRSKEIPKILFSVIWWTSEFLWSDLVVYFYPWLMYIFSPFGQVNTFPNEAAHYLCLLRKVIQYLWCSDIFLKIKICL